MTKLLNKVMSQDDKNQQNIPHIISSIWGQETSSAALTSELISLLTEGKLPNYYTASLARLARISTNKSRHIWTTIIKLFINEFHDRIWSLRCTNMNDWERHHNITNSLKRAPSARNQYQPADQSEDNDTSWLPSKQRHKIQSGQDIINSHDVSTHGITDNDPFIPIPREPPKSAIKRSILMECASQCFKFVTAFNNSLSWPDWIATATNPFKGIKIRDI